MHPAVFRNGNGPNSVSEKLEGICGILDGVENRLVFLAEFTAETCKWMTTESSASMRLR